MTRRHEYDLARRVSLVALAIIVIAGSFGAGLYSGDRHNWAYRSLKSITSTIKLVLHELSGDVASTRPENFIRPSRKPGSGVTIDKIGDDGQLILLTSFFDGHTGLRLIRRDGTIVADWPVSLSAHFPDLSYIGDTAPTSDQNVDIHGAVMEPDGSVVFNYEYVGAIRLSRCGDVTWTLKEPAHHSVAKAEKGGYWIPGRRFFASGSTAPEDQFPPFTLKQTDGLFTDDVIMHVSEDGQVLQQKSVMRILYENGLEPLITASGDMFQPDMPTRRQLLHVNKVAELPSAYAAAFPMFAPGDLLVSLRNYNLLMVVDPITWKVKWHQTGPWRRQHDPEFLADGRIAMFNNNTYRSSLRTFDRFDPDAPFVTEVGIVDPANGSYEDFYGNRPGQEMLSVIRGKIDPTPKGGFLITEFEAGRAIEIDASRQVVWEYINRYDDQFTLKITEAKLYPESYFTVTDWTCPANDAAGSAQ